MSCAAPRHKMAIMSIHDPLKTGPETPPCGSGADSDRPASGPVLLQSAPCMTGPARRLRRLRKLGFWLVSDDNQTADFFMRIAAEMQVNVRIFVEAGQLLRSLQTRQIGCIVIDARIDGHRGLALQQAISDTTSYIPIVVISGASDVATAVEAMRGGASDVLERPLTTARSVVCLERALAERGRSYEAYLHSVQLQRRVSQLTPREAAVLNLVMAGLPSRAIAQRLAVQEKTVEVYRSRINHKLHARNVADLARILHSTSVAGRTGGPEASCRSPQGGESRMRLVSNQYSV